MKLFFTGATGLVGTRLVHFFIQKGYQICLVTRDSKKAQEHFQSISNQDSLKIIQGDVTSRGDWQKKAFDADAVFHLAGANIMAQRWSKTYKEILRQSRIASTRCIAEVAQNVLVCASATGFYGDRGEDELIESSAPGVGFLSSLAQEWEEAAFSSNAQVCCMRLGIVLDPRGGALQKMSPLFKYYMGGAIGSGKQFWPWISWRDLGPIANHIIDERWVGPVNVVSPNQVSCLEFTKALARALNRPSLLNAPCFLIKLLLGESSSVLLSSQRVIPNELLNRGYVFKDLMLDNTIDELLLLESQLISASQG
ncbi:MAG TPA: TIGR01777 family protein [Opitutae bacterium]|nr:TIGR01777 family protein [Opitutae bacterium]